MVLCAGLLFGPGATNARAQDDQAPAPLTLPVVSFGLPGDLNKDFGWRTAGLPGNLLGRGVVADAETASHAVARWLADGERATFIVGARAVARAISVTDYEASRVNGPETHSWQADQHPAPAAHIGKKVQVTLLSGERHSGALVSLTSETVTIRINAAARTRDQAFALREVRRVVIERHSARRAALWAGLVTFGAVTLLSCGQGDEEDCWPEYGALYGGAAAGVGALVGAWRDQKSLPGRVIYPQGQPSTRLVPLLLRRAQGALVVVKW